MSQANRGIEQDDLLNDIDFIYSDTDDEGQNQPPTVESIPKKQDGRKPKKVLSEKQKETSRKNLEKARKARQANKEKRLEEQKELQTLRAQKQEAKHKRVIYEDSESDYESDDGEYYNLYEPRTRGGKAKHNTERSIKEKPMSKSEEKMLMKMERIEQIYNEMQRAKAMGKGKKSVHKTVIVQTPPTPAYVPSTMQDPNSLSTALKNKLLDIF